MHAQTALESAQRFASATQSAQALAERVASVIRYAVQARGRASLLLPGGNTPIAMFAALREQDCPWESVYISLTDERRVPSDDPQSNARGLREHLLTDRAAAAHFYPLHRDAIDARADEADCAAALAMLPRPFDAVVLGMGEDGHTASIFPDDPALARALNPTGAAGCVATQAPVAPHERLTLAMPTLLESRWMALQINGAAKWATLSASVQAADATRYPIFAVLNQRRVPVHIYWSP